MACLVEKGGEVLKAQEGGLHREPSDNGGLSGAGAENKNWGLPVGALVVVGKDGGGDLNQQQGELGGRDLSHTGRRPCGTLGTWKVLGLQSKPGFSGSICLVLSYAGGKYCPLLSCPFSLFSSALYLS